MTVLITTPWPLRSPGGGQRLAHGIADALAGPGFDVVVAAGSGLTDRAYAVVCDGRFREVRLRLAGTVARWGLRRQPAPGFSLEGLDSFAEGIRPQALLFTPHFSSCGLQARAVAETLGIPFLLCPAIHLEHTDHTNPEAKRFYRSADRVLCLSAIERNWLLEEVGIPSERLLMTGYPWHGPIRAPSQPIAQGSALRLLSVGAFVRHKRFEDQIDTLEILRREYQIDARLTLAGAGHEPSVILELERQARRRGCESHVRILTDVADDDLGCLYQDADAFLFTSRSESFAVAVLEAIARATPPLVYPHPVYRGHVEASGFGRVAAASTPQALAEAVVAAVDAPAFDPERITWLATHSPARVGAALAVMLEQLEAERPVSRT